MIHTLKPFRESHRRTVSATIMTREHDVLQNHLFLLLKRQYGSKSVSVEEGCVDIKCSDGRNLHFIEIKTSPRAKMAIREAIGQLLEYAYFPPTDQKHSPIMHIVAPGPLTDDVRAYITFMNKTFGLYFKYHQLTREMEQFDLAGENKPD